MIDDLLDIQSVMDLLGYSDERSLKKWCKKRNIPILSLGLKKYVSKHLLTQYIDNQIVTFEESNKVNFKDNPTSIQLNKTPNAQKEVRSDLVAKYIAKYESFSKSQTSGKGPS